MDTMDMAQREKALLYKEIDRLENALAECQRQGEGKLFVEMRDTIISAFERMTEKQHAAMQGIFACWTNDQIATAMNANTVKVKVYVLRTAKNLGVSRRDEVIIAAYDTFRAMSDEKYLAIAGIPKNWIKLDPSERKEV